ncbi:uncharacterized protein EV420DRAFT_1038122 [Desarmillaria tabescens]|uniref:Protein kinase domain-containing protein n=1 Tax=Armillaria tabescens TaxID=1929756 RepID=A0AA39NEX0_ARMTA|nr:uncharacterized protein EV420DRAFT_1038122 [Desarmillaria tabescens]KAK0464360.1 hypothetical protein EV420DRAFT_1038122 [Desarmillaria tabescens]
MGSDTTEQPRSGPAKLFSSEIFWRDHAAWLKECGYELRPRLRPGWVPSWTGTKKAPYNCEDGHRVSRGSVFIDAKDTSTGQVVAMKRIKHENNPNELAIGTLLTSEERSLDRRNHCVPILRTLHIPGEEGHVIIVMPYLRPWYDPKFKTIGEGIQFFREMLEVGYLVDISREYSIRSFQGLQFIHHNHVAHRDGGFTNIMMDATSMYGPDSFHPRETDQKYDFSGRARYRSRTERPPKYYFIDFGLSILYKPEELPATVCALEGGDKSVPEFLADNPDSTKRTPKHDPFAVDVYYLGNTFRAFLRRGVEADYKFNEKELRGMKGFEFMEPLIAAMTEPDPAKRIKIDEAVEKFALVEKGLSAMTLRSRVVYSADFTIFRPFKAVGHYVWTLGLIARKIPAIPQPSQQ